MSEKNGGENLTFSERLALLEASHVRLMTEHEVFLKEHEKRVAEQDREWEREKERWKQRDLEYERDRKAWREADDVLGRRITDLVSGMGEFMRRGGESERR